MTAFTWHDAHPSRTCWRSGRSMAGSPTPPTACSSRTAVTKGSTCSGRRMLQEGPRVAATLIRKCVEESQVTMVPATIT